MYNHTQQILTVPEIGDICRFNNAKKLVAFAGLDPITTQSGKFSNTTGHISKRKSPCRGKLIMTIANHWMAPIR